MVFQILFQNMHQEGPTNSRRIEHISYWSVLVMLLNGLKYK